MLRLKLKSSEIVSGRRNVLMDSGVLPVGHNAVLPFVSSPGEIRKKNHNRMTAFRLAPQTVNSSGPLFDGAGIPREIVVNDVTAESLEVNALSHHFAAHENIGEKRSIEGPHKA